MIGSFLNLRYKYTEINKSHHEFNDKMAFFTKLQANSVKDDAVNSKARSASVGDEANALYAEVEESVKVSTRGVKMRHAELKDLRRRIEGRIDVVKDDLVTFERVGKEFNLLLRENEAMDIVSIHVSAVSIRKSG